MNLPHHFSRYQKYADMVVMSELLVESEVTAAQEAEVDLARELRSTFVPGRSLGWPGARVAVRCIAGANSGGDIHGVTSGADEQYAVAVGTVTGPALYAAMAQAVLSGAVAKYRPASPSPLVLMTRLGRLIDRINADLRGQSVTCSMLHGVVDRATGTFEYVSAGTLSPMIWTRDGALRDLDSTGPALGSSPGVVFRCESLKLASLRRLIVCTDGVRTARSARGDVFGPSRISRLALDTMQLSPRDQVDATLRAVCEHAEHDHTLTADATVFVAEFAGQESAGKTASTKLWFRAYEQALGAVPDTSVFLG